MKRFLSFLVAVLILAAGIGYLVLQHRYSTQLRQVTADAESRLVSQRSADQASLRDMAEDFANALAITLADDLARKEYAAVEAQLGPIVQGHRVAGLLVLGKDGSVYAATDLRYRGRRLDDPATRQALDATTVTVAKEPPAPGQVEVDAPVYSGGRRIATLRIFIELGRMVE